jgi:Flp pilus assembly protein TadG
VKTKPGFFSLLAKLGKDKLASGPRLLARLIRDEAGSYLMFMGFTLPVLIGVAGLAGEASLLLYNHRTLQSAVDAAAYSAAIAYSYGSGADITTQAEATVASYGFAIGTNTNQANVAATVISPYANSGVTAIKVTASRPQSTLFSSYWSFASLSNSVSAIAIVSGAGGNGGQCILSLSTSGAPNPPNPGAGITVQGTSVISAPNCGVFSNSTASNSLLVGGTTNSISAGSVGVAGNLSKNGNPSINPQPTIGDGQMSDPYAGVTLPTPGTCNPDNAGVVKGSTTTLQPGTYCAGGISATNFANVTLAPGTYILENATPWSNNNAAQFTVDQHSILTGHGVTLVFTDPGGNQYKTPPDQAMNIQSGATVDLRAPAANATLGIPGMLIIGATNMPTTTTFDLIANSSSLISGVIYLPHGNFNWGGAPILSGGCTEMLAYTINLQGNAIFNNTGCQFPTGGGGGGGGINPIGSVVTLVN